MPTKTVGNGPIPKANLIGEKFGKLTVTRQSGVNKHSQTTWDTRCDCGSEKLAVSITSLKGGKTQSCGCLRKESWAKRPAKNIAGNMFTCAGCQSLKPLSERVGRQYRCVPCQAAYKAEWFGREPEKRRAATKKCREKDPERYRRICIAYRERHLNRVLWARARQRAAKSGLAFTITPDDIVIPEHCPVFGFPLDLSQGNKDGKIRWNSPSLDRLDNKKGYVAGNVVVISWRANALKKDASVAEFNLLVAWMVERGLP